MNGFLVDPHPHPHPPLYLALKADDQVRRFINIHLHYITLKIQLGIIHLVQRDDYQYRLASVLLPRTGVVSVFTGASKRLFGTFRQTAWPRWNKHPTSLAPGI